MPSSLIDFQDWTNSEIEGLFSLTQTIKLSESQPEKQSEKQFETKALNRPPVALLFFEPSTRTRMSFEMAAFRCGFGPVVLDGDSGSSLEKGESIEDTILNVVAMKPEFMVIRCPDSVPLKELAATQRSVKILNAGWGLVAHPTQALLDTMTMRDDFDSLVGKKLLIVGDVKHSRVASSHFELFPKSGIQVAICGPPEFLADFSENISGVQKFTSLDEGLGWADAVMALRVQFERHGKKMEISKVEYRRQYGLCAQKVKKLNPKGIIMHPGPVNWGIEMETEILKDSRCRILQQVTNGVYIREALMRWLSGERT